ncbi:hypothetical protein BLOT_010386 [Blomia tropicalis]|nr:hypothetical protein BLOT_010386 [Blomia tropicalis]
MPFSKWNLEPVYVSRAPPWSHLQHYHHHQQHQVLKSTTTNNNVINDSSLTTATTTNVQQTSTTTTTTTTNSETISLPPFVLKLSSIEDDTNRRDENRSTDDVDDEGGGRSDDIDSIEETTTNDDDTQRELSTKCESILLKIECRTMVGIVRQMAALLGAADQQFAEIVDECRKLTERSTLLRSRVVKLSGNVDRANLAIRQSPPQITSLLELLPDPTMNLKLTSSSNHNQRYINNNHHHCTLDISGRFGIPIFDHSSSSPTTAAASKWWHSNTTLETNLFAPETRPLSVRALYGRAHSPGDLRLSSNSFAIGNHSGVNCSTIGHYGYPSPFVTMLKFRRQQQQQQQLMLNNHAQSNLSQNRQQSMDQCRCDCGRCHRQSITSTTTNNNNINMNNSQNVNHNRNSSPSSLVTWSSVASSSAFESNPIVVKHHQNGTSMAKTMEQSAIVKSTITTKPVTNTSRRSTLLSSFSSADYDVEDYDQQITLPATTNTKIDDFFRANNVPINRNEMSDSIRIQCRCSCSIDQSSVTDIYSQIDSQIDQFTNVTNMTTTTTMTTTTNATTTNADQKRLESSTMNKSDCSNYWNWWLSDDEHRRWSSALTSPLKPATMIDEMSVWLRENIETRRPESVVFKSASDVPNHILLERALSPPCSSHSIQLRPKKLADSEQISINGDESKLRRRWSLFPIRRKSRQQHQSSSSGSVPPPLKSIKNNESSPSSSSTLQSNQFFNRFSRTRRSLPSSTTIRRNHLESNQTEHDDPQTTLPIDEEVNGPREVLLMSPEERFKLLAGQYSQSTIVNIDISGRNFNRLSMGRRSLIHTDFHIPRHRIGGIAGNNGSQQQQQRSRSKSPIKQHYKESNISPYALSGRLPEVKPNPIVVVAERGCQTENDDKLIRVDVHHNPSSNDNLRKNNDDDNDDDDDDYVMLLRKMSTNVPVRSKQQHSSNESTTNGSNGLPDSQTTTTTTTNIKQQQMRLNHDSQQTITLRYRGNELSAAAAKSRRQNGGRSSSGNWSAATSDLLQSSSTSSSPLQSDQQQQQQQQQKHQLNKIQRKRYQPTATKFANGKSLVAHQAVMATVSSVELTNNETNDTITHDFDCSVSHCSHQFINNDQRSTNNNRTIVSNGHRTLPDVEEKRRMTAAAMRRMIQQQQQQQQNKIKPGTRIRSVSGTFDDDDDDQTTMVRESSESSSDTIQLINQNQGIKRSASYRIPISSSSNYQQQQQTIGQQNYDIRRSKTMQFPPTHIKRNGMDQSIGRCKLLSSSSSNNRSNNRQCSSVALTESSSASSSCRKLPPPPPPPRMNGSNHNQQQLINHYSESETNSEYLHHGNERRRRLFLLDSNRSYPPLYVPPISTYDGTHSTDTATTISGGSELFDDEDGDGGGDNYSKIGEHEDDDVNYDSRIRKIDDDRSMETIATKESETSTLCSGGGGGNSVTPTADNSSRTITPTFDTNTIDRKDKVEDEIDEERKVVVAAAAAAAAVVEEESRSQFGTLERKQLEERHLSSPLPPPKLASFVRMGENQRMNECERQRKCSTTSSTTSSSTSPPKSPPKPKPHLFIILHNSKKRHNIRTEPEIFTSNRMASPQSPQSPNGSERSNQSPKLQSPQQQQQQQEQMKRRSWTGIGNPLSSPNRMLRNNQQQQQQPQQGSATNPEIVSPLSPARVSSLGTHSSPSGSPSSRSRFSPSPIVSPMSPISNRQTMNLFVKKFGKSTTTSNGRYESSNYAGLNHVNVSCPPIPEVPDCPTGENGSESVPTNNSSTSTSSSSANNMKHNCTSTWV